MPKWLYIAAFLFVLFLIYNDPSDAGNTAGNFAGFVVDLLGAVGEFLSGLFEGADGSTNSSGVDSGSGSGSSVAPNVQSGAESGAESIDTFRHTHDGVTHSHPVNEN